MVAALKEFDAMGCLKMKWAIADVVIIAALFAFGVF